MKDSNMVLLLGIIFIILNIAPVFGVPPAEFWEQRSQLLKVERGMFLGSDVVLNAAEHRANTILMAAKEAEFARCFDPLCFPPARHFFEAKTDIEASQVFSIIRSMPKGAALHGHDTGMVSTEWLVSNATYRDNLYACTRVSQIQPPPPLNLELVRLLFSSSAPEPTRCSEGAWILVSTLRAQVGNATKVDRWFKHHLTLVTDDPSKYKDVNVAWEYFMQLFDRTDGLLQYKSLFRDYFVQSMQEMLDDNVQYLELRGILPPTYDLDGSQSTPMEVAAMYQEESAAFLASAPVGEWFGMRFIYSPIRFADNNTMDTYANTTEQLLKTYPELIAGFDLVGQEDKGSPYTNFIQQLLRLRENIPDLKFFFHAGETNWQGLTDMNLVDAVLLNSTRIGHGFAISKHPAVKELAREKGIAIEVNPISNQVLKLVEDLRNHPASPLMAEGYPVVVSCDDPSFWGARGVSYDWYQMFMGIAGREADLRLLKKLAINSFIYNAMGEAERECALQAWNVLWDEFIASLLSKAESGPPPNPNDRPQPRAECLELWKRKVRLPQD